MHSSKPFFLFPIGTSSVATTPGDHALSVGSSPPGHVGSNLVATPTHPSMMPIPRKVSLGGHSLNSVGSSYCGSASSSCSTTLNRSHAPASHAPQSHHHHNHHHTHHHVHHNPAASGVAPPPYMPRNPATAVGVSSAVVTPHPHTGASNLSMKPPIGQVSCR